MLSGFNTNIRHRGLLLHVQTEDSGRAHPHVITHLYHGGTILASEKSEYGDRLAADDVAGEVRSLMEGQHRAMLKRLRHGELDARLRERLGADVFGEDPHGDTASGSTGPTAPALAESVSEPAPAAVADPGREGEERPLDEVVLEYLVERARKPRRRRS
jgi:hypothetical protein